MEYVVHDKNVVKYAYNKNNSEFLCFMEFSRTQKKENEKCFGLFINGMEYTRRFMFYCDYFRNDCIKYTIKLFITSKPEVKAMELENFKEECRKEFTDIDDGIIVNGIAFSLKEFANYSDNDLIYCMDNKMLYQDRILRC